MVTCEKLYQNLIFSSSSDRIKVVSVGDHSTLEVVATTPIQSRVIRCRVIRCSLQSQSVGGSVVSFSEVGVEVQSGLEFSRRQLDHYSHVGRAGGPFKLEQFNFFQW